MKAEYARDDGFLQRDSVEREEYAEAQSAGQMETAEQDNASDLMEKILERGNTGRPKYDCNHAVESNTVRIYGKWLCIDERDRKVL